MSKLRRLTVLGVILCVLAGCGSSAGNEDTVKKDTLNLAMTVDPDDLDPQRTVAASTFQITSNIYDTLVSVDETGKIIDALAKSYSVSDDGLEITFVLNEGVEFHNGNPVDADAVIASFERLQEEESPRAKDYASIKEMVKVNDHTVTFKSETLDVAWITQFAYPWAAIVDVSVADSLKTQPIGSGSYKLTEWIPQQKLVLEANENALAEPSIKNVVFTVLPDAATRISAFEAQEIDVLQVTGDQVTAFEGKEQYTIVESEMNSVQLMAMNLQNEYLSNEKVRQAINYAVDKDALIQTVWYGSGNKIGSHFPSVLPEYKDLSYQYSFDIETAKALLKEAGYEDGFTLKMYLPKNYQQYVDAGQIIAENLKQININVEINIIEWASWLSDVYAQRNYDLTVVGHTGRLDPYVLLARYHSGNAENYFNYSNPEVDALLEGVKQEKDSSKRTAMYQEIQTLLAEDVPALYIQSPLQITVTQAYVEGVKSYPIDIYRLTDFSFK